jgi:hypothetical protein
VSDFFDSTDFFSGSVDIPAEQLADISTPAIDPYGLDAGFPTLGTDTQIPFDSPSTIYSIDGGYASTAGISTGIDTYYYNPNGVESLGGITSTSFADNSLVTGSGVSGFGGMDAGINTQFYNPNGVESLGGITSTSFADNSLVSGTGLSGTGQIQAGINTQFGGSSSVYNVDFSLNNTLQNVDFSADRIAGAPSITSGFTSGSGESAFNINGLISGISGGNIGGLVSGISGAAGLGNITSSISSVNSVLANISKLTSGGGANISNITGLISGVSGLISSVTGGQTQFNSQGIATGGSDKPNINKDTMALTQIGVYTNPGFFGDQSMKNSNSAFNNVVNLLSAVSGIASMLRTNPSPPPNYVRTPTNYILTDREKQEIQKKSLALSSYGVVPQDILSAFFYILSALENPADLLYVAQVTGIPELGDIRYVRNIYGILSIKDIYKVGYLANGVASIINKYASIFSSAAYVANPNLTTFGDVEQARTLALALGIIGPVMLSSANSLNGNIGILANAPNLSSSNIDRVVNSTINMAAGQAINLIGTALTNPSADIGQMASQIGVNAIKNVLNSTPLGGVLSAFGSFGGIAGGPLLSQMGGYAIGNFMSELITGKRIPTQKIANNPSLRPPSYQGKAFFGETPVSLPAVDQLFCRKVGSFGEPTGGSGTDSFGMQNFASFGGVMDVASVVTKMITGSSKTPDTNTYYGQSVNTVVSNVANILNVKNGSSIEMRRSDNAIPMMIGLSAAIAGQAFSPFGSGTMSNGWKLASSTANDIQNINPEFLQTCITSL